jgi:hypothetical protein
VCRVVADQIKRLLILARQDADLGVVLDRLGKVARLAVELDGDGLFGKGFGDLLGNVAPRDALLEGEGGTIGERQVRGG